MRSQLSGGPLTVWSRIAPYQYLHVLDTNTSVTRNINGPCTFTRQDHEKVVQGPTAMITIPPRHYVIIADPAIHDEEGKVCLDEHGPRLCYASCHNPSLIRPRPAQARRL